MKILITAPSLNEDENVSGISTLVRNIVKYDANRFEHFEAGRKDGEAAGAGWIARQAALPFRFFGRIRSFKPDLVHLNTAFIPLAIMRDAALAASARIAGCPVLLHVHGGPLVAGNFTNPVVRTAAEKLLQLSAAVVVFSDAEAKQIVDRFPGTNIKILPNAVPLPEIPERQSSSPARTIIFFGRLNRSKGLDHIVAACRSLREQGFAFRYVCCGAGPEMISFCSQMSSVLGGDFDYRGVVKGQDKWKVLSEADVFFQPSRDEGLPIALLEAMAAGCVPVMSASGAVADVIEDGRNGFLIEAGNTQQTVGKLKFLLSEGPAGLRELRENARRTVAERYSFDKYVSALDRLYKELVRNSESAEQQP